MYIHRVDVPLAHHVKRDKTSYSDSIGYHRSYGKISPVNTTVEGDHDTYMICGVCSARVPLIVNQQQMVLLPAKDLAKNRKFRRQLIRRLLAGRVFTLLFILACALLMAASVYWIFTNPEYDSFMLLAIFGYMYPVIFGIYWLWGLPKFIWKLVKIGKAGKDTLISPYELEKTSLPAPAWASENTFIRQVKLYEDAKGHSLRAGETGEFSHSQGDTVTTTTITGENLWTTKIDYFNEVDEAFIQIGGGTSAFALPDPNRAKFGTTGTKSRLSIVIGGFVAAAFFSLILPIFFLLSPRRPVRETRRSKYVCRGAGPKLRYI